MRRIRILENLSLAFVFSIMILNVIGSLPPQAFDFGVKNVSDDPSTNAAYIYTDDARYPMCWFNSTGAGFLFKWHSAAWFYWPNSSIRAHSNYGYELNSEDKIPFFFRREIYPYHGEFGFDNSGTGSLTILRNASDFSLVKETWTDLNPSPIADMTMYLGFWKDRPYVWTYFITNAKRNDTVYETHFSFGHSSSMSSFYFTNYTGSIANVNASGDYYTYFQTFPIFSAMDKGAMERFPFFAFYNSTIDVTVGYIVTWATPNIRKDLSLGANTLFEVLKGCHSATDMSFNENWPATQQWTSGQVMGVEMLFFLKAGSPLSSGNVADYSEWLFNNATQSTNLVEDVNPEMWSATNQRWCNYSAGVGSNVVGVRGWTPYVANSILYQPKTYYIPYMKTLAEGQSGPELEYYDGDYMIPFYSNWYLSNDESMQILLDPRDVTEAENETVQTPTWMDGYVAWNRYNCTSHSHVKAYCSSDKLLYYGNVTLIQDSYVLNSSFVLFKRQAQDVVQISSTEYDFRFNDPLYGWAGIYVKVYAGAPELLSDRLNINLVNYSTPQWETAGTSFLYNFSIWGHQGNATTMTPYFTQQPLNYTRPFFNFALSDNRFGFDSRGQYVVLNSTAAGSKLSFWALNVESNQLNLQVFVESSGQPSLVRVAGLPTTFTYSSDTKLASINVTFQGPTLIELFFGTNHWQMTFSNRDIDNNAVDSLITWQLYNGSQLLTYTQGSYSLLDGNYTLKTYYHGILLNTTTFYTAIYGDTTVSIFLQMKAQSSVSGGYIAFNNTITSITINSQTSENLTFTVTGSSPTMMIVDVPAEPEYIRRNGVDETGFTYVSSPSYVYKHISSLDDLPTQVTWNLIFPAAQPLPIVVYLGIVLGIALVVLVAIALKKRQKR
jgi:hypothetical protein